MPEFLATMNITFPHGTSNGTVQCLLDEEAEAARPYLESGQFARAWRTYGEHFGSHGHMALWNAEDINVVNDAYASFPLIKNGFATNLRIQPLAVNPNDPNNLNDPWRDGFPLTYDNLHHFLDLHGERSHVVNEGLTAELTEGVTVHDHPVSGRPREIHFMVGGQKVAEIGPVTGHPGEDVAPSYVDLLAEWDGKPVAHEAWKQRILVDNNLVHPSYTQAVISPRIRHQQ
jgi:muconolactone delta-isomerase